MPRIIIDTIPHDGQRYDTAGDWFYGENGELHVFVSAMSDRRYETLLIVHELVEALLCNHDGISAEAVDNFDMVEGAALDDPGLDERAPYHKQHMVADAVERTVAAALGVDWVAYDAAVLAL